MESKRIGGLVIGGLVTIVSGLALLVVLFQIVQDLSGTFFRYTYVPPWTPHELSMVVLLFVTGSGTLVGLVTAGISAFAGKAKAPQG